MCNFRCNDDAQFFHNVERFPVDVAGGVEFDSDERLGWRMYVFHLRLAAGVRLRELRGPKTAPAQCRLSPRRKSRHTSEFSTRFFTSV